MDRHPLHPATTDENAVSDIWTDVNSLVGLNPFKEWLTRTERRIRYNLVSGGGEDRTDQLFPSRVVFSGPPGCGKTTAAALAARMLQALGCIGEHVVGPVSLTELKLSYLGNSVDKIGELLQAAKNGAIIIEEAPVYNDHDRVRLEVIKSLLEMLLDPEYGRTLVIFTELNEQFEVLLQAHPEFGELLERVEFASFTPEECAVMLDKLLGRQNLVISEEVFQHVRDLAEEEQFRKGELFANGLWVQRVARGAIARLAETSSADGAPHILDSIHLGG